MYRLNVAASQYDECIRRGLFALRDRPEIEPGEIYWIDKNGEHTTRFTPPAKKTVHCVFEHVYFAQPPILKEEYQELQKYLGKNKND